MKITSKPVIISHTLIESCLWHIQRSIIKHHGFDQSERDIAPLKWYINTGRASLDFLNRLVEAKPFMIGRKLHEGGSYEDAIQRVKNYIGFDNEGV